MYERVVPGVLSKYGLEYRQIFPFESGYRNEIWPVVISDGRKVNLTFFKREDGILDRINQADAVSQVLADSGMPARVRLFNHVLQLKSGQGVTYAAIYNYLPGSTIPWESYTMERIKNLGKAMSDMHFYLQDYPVNLPSVYDEYQQVVSRMQGYFQKVEVINAMQDKLSVSIGTDTFRALVNDMAAMQAIAGQQPLHMDFVRSNVLFDGNEICGILDFEKTAKGHPVVDIARTLAFLFVDCKYKSPEKVIKYFLRSGYLKRGMSKEIGIADSLNGLVKLFLAYDFYKFLAHNPYESLSANEHYVRTRDMLLRADVIKYT